MPSLLIRGGRIIDPASQRDQTGDLLIADGQIAAIEVRSGGMGALHSALHGDQVFDAEGCIVCPGLVDPHVHLREPSDGRHEETIRSGAAAAINGGFTTVCCMPNTRPPLDSPDLVRFVHDRASEAALARVFVAACASAGREGRSVAPIQAMADAGAVAFTDDGEVIADAVMADVLRHAKEAGRCVMQHCQDPAMTQGSSMNAGPVAERMKQIGWPVEAEEAIIRRDIELNRTIGCQYHAQHLSSGGSVELLRRAQSEGLPVSGEVSPHHLLLTDEACEQLGTVAKMNPPLRTQRDIDMLKEGVADGTIAVLATDHAPHPAATKNIPFAQASFGIVGLDCALPLYIKALIDDGVIDWPRMIAMMTAEPARLIGLNTRGIGGLRVGLPADVTVIDPSLEWTIDPKEFASAGRNCPFAGWKVRGRAIAVFVDGVAKLMREPVRVVPV